MAFVYEDISQEDFVNFEIGVLKERVQKLHGTSLRKWSVNESKDVYLILVKATSRDDDEDFGTSFYVMNLKGTWADFETITIAFGGEYKGETWTNFGITKISPFVFNAAGQKQQLEINDLPIPFEALISTFCEALTARSRWMNDESTKHTVTFENLTVEGS